MSCPISTLSLSIVPYNGKTLYSKVTFLHVGTTTVWCDCIQTNKDTETTLILLKSTRNKLKNKVLMSYTQQKLCGKESFKKQGNY